VDKEKNKSKKKKEHKKKDKHNLKKLTGPFFLGHRLRKPLTGFTVVRTNGLNRGIQSGKFQTPPGAPNDFLAAASGGGRKNPKTEYIPYTDWYPR
jgi:hypothetical protein